MDEITVPTLLLNAADDPICSVQGVAEAAAGIRANPNVIAVVTREGGHVAWAQGWGRPGRTWENDATVEYIAALLARRGYTWDVDGAPALPLRLPRGADADEGAPPAPVGGAEAADERRAHLEA